MLEACVDHEENPCIKHFDIKPSNIVLNFSGQAKLLCRGTYPGFIHGLQLVLSGQGMALLAPEEVEAVRHKRQSSGLVDSVSETFSVALTAL